MSLIKELCLILNRKFPVVITNKIMDNYIELNQIEIIKPLKILLNKIDNIEKEMIKIIDYYDEKYFNIPFTNQDYINGLYVIRDLERNDFIDELYRTSCQRKEINNIVSTINSYIIKNENKINYIINLFGKIKITNRFSIEDIINLINNILIKNENDFLKIIKKSYECILKWQLDDDFFEDYFEEF